MVSTTTRVRGRAAALVCIQMDRLGWASLQQTLALARARMGCSPGQTGPQHPAIHQGSCQARTRMDYNKAPVIQTWDWGQAGLSWAAASTKMLRLEVGHF